MAALKTLMVEYLIASLECMPSIFMAHKKASFLILVAGSLLEAIYWTGSKTVAIIASKICMLLQMVQVWRRKSITTEKTLETIQMDVSFVWNPFLLGVLPYKRRVLIAWCVQFIIINFYDYVLQMLLIPLLVFMLNNFFCSKQMTQASCFP